MAIKYTVTVHGLFKYMMRILYTRVNQEWQDLAVTYPRWLHTLVMDEFYYTTTLVVACIACFGMGLIAGIVWTVV